MEFREGTRLSFACRVARSSGLGMERSASRALRWIYLERKMEGRVTEFLKF
jgi:hypothetical protein